MTAILNSNQAIADPLMELLSAWPMARIWVEPVPSVSEAESVLAIAERTGNDLATAWSLLVIGSGLAIQGMHSIAEERILRASDMFVQLGDELGRAHAILRMDLIWLDREDFETAIPELELALTIARKYHEWALESAVLNDLGLQHDLAGEPKRAAEHLFRALEIASDDERAWQATIRYNIGHVLSNQPDHAAAVQWLEEALEIAEEIGDVSTTVYAHESLANSFEALGVHDMAILHVVEGLEKAITFDYRRSIAALSLEAGRLLSGSDPVAAAMHCQNAAATYRSLDDEMLIARAWIAEWRSARIDRSFTDELRAGLDQAIQVVQSKPTSEQTVFEYLDALVETCTALDMLPEALAWATTAAERKQRYWQRLAEQRGMQSAERHQLDHAEAVARREREQRIALTRAMHELKELNTLNEALVQQLQEQATLLERQATEDSLTGIGNRRYFDSHLERESIRSVTFGRPISVAMADVDLFKNVNDRYTHQIGDVVLKLIAEIIRSECREMDIFARYGGEEFAFLFAETSLTESAEQADRIRRAVETFDWNQVVLGLRVTMSIGVVCSENGAPPDRLMASADSLLYLAKHRGRNQVRSSPLNQTDNVQKRSPQVRSGEAAPDLPVRLGGTDHLRRVTA